MKTKVEHRDVQAEGVKDGWSFFLAMGPKIMEILAGQYTNLPLAVVREYLANIMDAYHGLDPEQVRAPELHLPTELEPWIEFKDYGVGMSFDTVRQVFSGFGVTTKDDSNDVGGGFGIGSKVMFAFMRAYNTADQWTVESRWEGERMIFAATRDEKGMPFMYHVATVETDEPNGVTIKGPVPPRLIEAFIQEAKYVLTYFPLEVVMTGFPVDQSPPEYALRGKSWGIKAKSAISGGNSRAIIGGVPYRLDIYQLIQAGVLDHSATSSSFDFYLPIGVADIAPSREGLEYSDDTIAALKEVVADMDAALSEIVSKKIDAAETAWEAMLEAERLAADPMVRRVLHTISWRGKTLDLNQGVSITAKKIQQLGGEVEVLYAERGKCSTFREVAKDDLTFSFSPRKQNHIILINDVERGEKSRSKEGLLAHHAPKNSYSGKRSPKWERTTAYIIKPKDGVKVDKLVAKLTKALDGAPLGKRLSEILMPERAKGAGGKATLKTLEYNGFDHWDAEPEADEEVEGVFVRANGSSLIDYGDRDAARHLWNKLREAKLVPNGQPLLVIPRSRSDVEEVGDVEELTDFAKRVVAKAMADRAVEFADYKVMQQLHINDNLMHVAKELPPTHPAHNVAKRVKKAKAQDHYDLNALSILANRLGLQWPSARPTIRKAGVEKVMSRYPLLEMMHDARYNRDGRMVKGMLEYIEMIDLFNYLNG